MRVDCCILLKCADLPKPLLFVYAAMALFPHIAVFYFCTYCFQGLIPISAAICVSPSTLVYIPPSGDLPKKVSVTYFCETRHLVRILFLQYTCTLPQGAATHA